MSEIKLKNGKVISPNGGYIGINEKLDISQGYDNVFITEDSEWYADDDSSDKVSNEELKELCDIMIDRWIGLKAVISEF